MDETQVSLFYEEMKAAFVKPDSSWTDKGTIFRTILENLFKNLTPEMDNSCSLNDRINAYYDSHPQEESHRFRAHRVRRRTNSVVHNSIRIEQNKVYRTSLSKKDIRDIYEDIVLVLFGVTKQFPDDATFELLGVNSSACLNGLNEQQKDAVLCNSPIVFVNAGPGTGKTTLLVRKLVHYILNNGEKNKTVALSFTNTAAHQLGDKFQEQAIRYIRDINYEFYSGTIHSFCLRKLRKYYQLTSRAFNYLIIGDDDLFELVYEICNRTDGQYTTEQIAEFLKSGPNMWPAMMSQAINDIKKEYKLISLNDILNLFIEKLNTEKDFASWLLDAIDLLVIDEAQDLTESNFKIFDKMMEIKPELNLFLVGDPRQNIFEFNGGSYCHLETFLQKHLTRVALRSLSISYRCPDPILNFVNGFEFSDCDNIRISSDIVGAVTTNEYLDQKEEARSVCDAIESFKDIDSCSVLSPNIKGFSFLIEELNRRGIPYVVFGGRRRLKAPFRIVNNLLRILWNNDEKSIRSIGRDFNVDVKTQPQGAARHFSPKELFYRSTFGRKLRAINDDYTKQGWQIPNLLDVMIDKLFTDGMKKDHEAMEDMKKLRSFLAGFKTIKEYLDNFSIDKDKYVSFYEKDFQESVTPVDDGALTLSTIHSAKGLEWKHVFLVGMYELNFPGIEKYRNKNQQKQESYLNAKKKEMYVACTRSSCDLNISFPANVDKKPQEASRLLFGLRVRKIYPN